MAIIIVALNPGFSEIIEAISYHVESIYDENCIATMKDVNEAMCIDVMHISSIFVESMIYGGRGDKLSVLISDAVIRHIVDNIYRYFLNIGIGDVGSCSINVMAYEIAEMSDYQALHAKVFRIIRRNGGFNKLVSIDVDMSSRIAYIEFLE